MRPVLYLTLAALLQIPTGLSAQQVSVAGWVQSVDTANSTITIRTLGNPRTIQVAPEAVIRVNGAAARLDQLPLNAAISIVAERGPNNVLRATQVTVTRTGADPRAAAPPGSLITGTLVGMDIPGNMITIRTRSGDHAVPLGTAPILVNGVRGSSRDLRLGQTVQVERALPTEGSTDYVTQVIRVMPAGGAAGTGAAGARGTGAVPGGIGGSRGNTGLSGAGIVDRGTPVRSRTRGYSAVYRSRRPATRVSARRSTRSGARSRTRSGSRVRSRTRGYRSRWIQRGAARPVAVQVAHRLRPADARTWSTPRR